MQQESYSPKDAAALRDAADLFAYIAILARV
jgi:hypothetical protein